MALFAEESGQRTTSNIFIVSMGVLCAMILLSAYWLIYDQGWRRYVPTDYVIPNVPYIGLHNHVGEYAYLNSVESASVAMVLEYWNPGKNNFDAIRRTLDAPENQVNGGSFFTAIRSLGEYDVFRERLEISELGKYLNGKTRTPLLLYLAFDEEASDEGARGEPAVSRMILLIGKNDKDKQLVFHDYWFGNNYVLSYEDFDRLQNLRSPEQRNYYIIVRPKRLSSALRDVKSRAISEYPRRTEVMERAVQLLNEYGVGYIYLLRGDYANALEHLLRAEQSAEFERYAPPFIKTKLYFYIGSAYQNQQDASSALAYAQKAISTNKDLDKPYMGWPGYQLTMNRPSSYGMDSLPYELLGDVYSGLGKWEEALEAYKSAYAIYPKRAVLSEKISEVENQQARIR